MASAKQKQAAIADYRATGGNGDTGRWQKTWTTKQYVEATARRIEQAERNGVYVAKTKAEAEAKRERMQRDALIDAIAYATEECDVDTSAAFRDMPADCVRSIRRNVLLAMRGDEVGKRCPMMRRAAIELRAELPSPKQFSMQF
jgi:hypothetical protein